MNTRILYKKLIHLTNQIFRILLLLVLSSNDIHPQSTKPLFQNLNKEFPEIDNSVMDIIRDSRGYVWLAGQQYLERFDGMEVKKYHLYEYPQTDDIHVLNRFIEDSRNNLWIFFRGMMLLYDPVFDDFYYFKFDLPDTDISKPNLITAFEEDKKGNLWIAFSNQDFPLIRIPFDSLVNYITINPDNQFPRIIKQDQFEYIPSTFYEGDKYSSPGTRIIRQILFDWKNDLWINREGWVERFIDNDTLASGAFVRYLETRNDEGKILNQLDKYGERMLHHMFLDKNDRVWMQTKNRLYQFLDNHDNKTIPKDSLIKFPEFDQSLYTDYKYSRNTVFQDKWINTYTLAPDLNYNLRFYFKTNNQLWFERSQYRIDVFSIQYGINDHAKIKKINEIESLPGDPCSWQFWLYPLFLDEEGILWLADRDSKGYIADGIITLNTIDMNRYQKIYHSVANLSSIPENEVGPIHKDYMGNTWFFPYSFRHQENIVYLSNKDYTNFQVIKLPEHDNTPTGDFLDQTWIDAENRLWFIGGWNIHVISLPAFYAKKNPKEWHHQFNIENFIIPEEGDVIIVHNLILDNSGNLWMYAVLYNNLNPKRDFNWGLYYYDTDQLKNLEFDQYNNIRFLKYDQFKNPGDTLYFGCYNTGILKYWETWKPEFDHHNQNNIYLLSNMALIRIDPVSKDYDIFDTGNPDPGSDFTNIINGTLVTDDSASDSITIYGTLTTGGFISHTFYDQPGKRNLKTKKVYLDQEGLKYNSWRLLRDKTGSIWSHADNQGILKYDPRKDKFIYFINEYTFGGWSYCGGHYIDRDGFMYLQSSDGIIIFHPDSLKENPYVPPVNISDIKILGRSIIRERDSVYLNTIKSKQTVTIPYHQNLITLDFNAMSLYNLKNNRYQYKLDGWDRDWIHSGYLNRTANYSNLSPGSYTFRVIGSNNDGIWNEDGAFLNIVVLPPWWLTWWAKTVYLLLFISTIWGFIYLRLRKQKLKLREMQKINDAFSKFVPYEFLHAIGREYIMDVKLGDKTYQDVTVLFLDIRNYTTLAEAMTPDDNFAFIQKFVGLMGPVIINNMGFVNQYLGDGIMAIFPEKVDDALKAAIDMQKELANYNQKRVASGKGPIQMGVGLHTGPLIMGIIGDEKRSDPATIADTVNTASRLEGMTKYYGIRILISEESLILLKSRQNYHTRYLGEVLVKGKNKPIKVYECFDGDEENIRYNKVATLNQFEKGLEYFYQRDFIRASVIFNEITKVNPDDRTASYFYNKSAIYASEGVPEEWTGVEKMEMK